jgi:hypothetical protein
MAQVLDRMAEQYERQGKDAWRAFCGDYLEIARFLQVSPHFCRRAKLLLAQPEAADGLAIGLEYFDGVARWLGALFWRAFHVGNGEAPPSLLALQAVKRMLDKAFDPAVCGWKGAHERNAAEVLRWYPVVWSESSRGYTAARGRNDVAVYQWEVLMTQLVNIGIGIDAKLSDRASDDGTAFAADVLKPWETDTQLVIDHGNVLQVTTSEGDLNRLRQLLAPN